MTLVIDNTQKLASAKPEFLDTLQDFAKDAADSGNLQVVFVSSDFTVLARMQRRSEWSRCAQPLEIGESDVSEQAAVSYLMARLGWPADANHTEVASESCPCRMCAPTEAPASLHFAATLQFSTRHSTLPLECLFRHLQRTSWSTSRARALRC